MTKKIYKKPTAKFHQLVIQRIGIGVNSDPEDARTAKRSISFDDNWDDVKDEW